MTKQTIYGRFEYPLGNTTSEELFEKYRSTKVLDERGIQVGGISSARNVSANTAILMTYDEESEVFLTLALSGLPNVKHNSFIKV